jgi:predicted signal transduction protein with EAL and GGDEF domain
VLGARIGASVGVAVLGADGEDFDGLYAVADARLYQQKKPTPRYVRS